MQSMEEKEMAENKITDLEMNICKYMDIKEIKYYSELLKMIGAELGMNYQERIDFAAKQKSNFSKMLKGERPLERKFIEPLEKILGVSLAKLTCEYSYDLPLDESDIPFIKGFRYYAHKDDPKLYEELDKMCTLEGNPILSNTDEYEKGFLDYLVEYQAINGIRFLSEKHNFVVEPYGQTLMFSSNTLYRNMFCANYMEVAKLIIRSSDSKLFNKVFNNFECMVLSPWVDDNLWCKKEEFIDEVINNEKIFESIFKINNYSFDAINRGCNPKDGKKPDIKLINPLIECCLDYALKNLAYYKDQALKILNFAMSYNKEIIHTLDPEADRYCIQYKYYVCESHRRIHANLILTDITQTGDKEIDEMISKLPTIKINAM